MHCHGVPVIFFFLFGKLKSKDWIRFVGHWLEFVNQGSVKYRLGTCTGFIIYYSVKTMDWIELDFSHGGFVKHRLDFYM